MAFSTCKTGVALVPFFCSNQSFRCSSYYFLLSIGKICAKGLHQFTFFSTGQCRWCWITHCFTLASCWMVWLTRIIASAKRRWLWYLPSITAFSPEDSCLKISSRTKGKWFFRNNVHLPHATMYGTFRVSTSFPIFTWGAVFLCNGKDSCICDRFCFKYCPLLSTESQALLKSINSRWRGRLCSVHISISSFLFWICSMVPSPLRKPACSGRW